MKQRRLPIITAALWLIVGIMLGVALMVTGCGGEIDPGNPIRVTSSSEASGSWIIERRPFK